MLLAGLSASMSILRCDSRSERLFDLTESVLGIGISGESTPTLTLSFRNLRLGHNSGAISFCLNLELQAKIAK